MSAQHGKNLPTVGGCESHPGQESPPLDELAEHIRDAHAGITAAFSNAIDRAIDAGRTLIIAKKLVPHRQWGKFLKRCGVGERQTERYMRLARLVAANPTCKSDLAELSIEQAIKLLSPPKPPKDTPACGQPLNHGKSGCPIFTSSDIIAAWIGSLPVERTRALNAVGLDQVLAAMPQEWWPLIESIVVHRHLPLVTAASNTTGDLEIRTFLRRELIAAPLNAESGSALKHDPKVDDPSAAYSSAAGRGIAEGPYV
jgi:hypothetical protein